MAHTPPIRRIYTQDIIDGDGKIDGEKLLYPLNLFLETTYNLFDGGIHFADNITSQINGIAFTTASDYIANTNFTPVTFLLNMNKRPQGVIVLQTQVTDDINTIITNPVTVHWSEKTESISIDFVTGLADSTTYNMNLLVI